MCGRREPQAGLYGLYPVNNAVYLALSAEVPPFDGFLLLILHKPLPLSALL